MDRDDHNNNTTTSQPSIPPRSLVANEPTPPRPTRDICSTSSSTAACCCGSECSEHGLALRSLEKDVRDAARVGQAATPATPTAWSAQMATQDFNLRARRTHSANAEESLTWSLQALLLRHETYVAEAQTERSRLSDEVVRLERSNQDLEARNAQLVAENTALLDQADEANNSVHESEVKIQTLTTTLYSTQRELERVTRLAIRTETLEAQLLECEREQARLQATLARSNEEERAALQKWRNSHRRVLELEDQIEAIEKEALEERQRHVEVEQRFERRRAVETELESPATPRGQGHERRGSEVVSSFVKEILQDNANMQLAMVDLQDLVAYYREAELAQGTLPPDEFEDGEARHLPTLNDELSGDRDESPHREQGKQRQVHVHHHYHAPSSAAAAQRQPRSRSQLAPRPKKRRPLLVSGRSTPVNMSRSPPRPPAQRHKSNLSTASSVGSFDNRVSKQKRWSSQSAQSQSSFTVSSGPSSPRSTSYCPSTIFEHDRANDQPTEYSRPTSPESNAGLSLQATPVHRKFASSDSSFQPLSIQSRLAMNEMAQAPNDETISTISEHSTDETAQDTSNKENMPRQKSVSPTRQQANISNNAMKPPLSPTRNQSPRRPLRRTDSQTSLFSISGMDIHSTFPSPAHAPRPKHPLNLREQPGAVLTAATASALKSSQLNGSNGGVSRSLRGRLGADGIEARNDRYSPLTDTFGKRFGGWLASRWSSTSPTATLTAPAAPVRQGSSLRPKKATPEASIREANEGGGEASRGDQSQTSPLDIPSVASPADAEKENLSLSTSPRKLAFRAPGVNQYGGLPPLPLPGGFSSIGRVPITRMVDEEALKEALEQTPEDSSMVPAPV